MATQNFSDDTVANHRNAHDEIDALGEFGAWIGGESRSAASGDTFETVDPVVAEPIRSVPRCGSEDVDDAVATAGRAFETTWSEADATERSRRLLEWTDRLREATDDLALIESVDGGKPLRHARAEVHYAIEFLEYYAKVIVGDESVVVPTGDDSHVYTRHEPFGVVGLIVPWNYPLTIAAWKLGPALAAGNAVVLKPAEQTPLSIVYAAELSASILPDGVLNVVPGYGEEAGAPLVEHDGVGKISFTGEDVTGEEIMRNAAENVTPVTLELGGKSPYVVFPDADLDEAASDVAEGIFYNAGQSCDACSRLVVHEDVADEFTERLVERANSLVVGDTLEEGTHMGPLVSREQYDKVVDYVETGLSEGATLETGGVPEESPLGEGWYVEPTVFVDVDSDMRIAREEIFGPVETVFTFADYDEAIELANDTEFGLAAGVATADNAVAHRAAADIEAGSVWVNGGFATPIPGAPFGGYKRSGIGRELHKDALRHYTREKSVYMSIGDPSL